MGKIKRNKENKGKGRGPRKGAVYVVKTDVEFADVNNDGIADLVIDHSVSMDGEIIQSSKLVWYRLDKGTQAELEATGTKNGIEDFEGEFRTFREVVHYWKKFTKVLKEFNDLGDMKSDELQEPQVK